MSRPLKALCPGCRQWRPLVFVEGAAEGALVGAEVEVVSLNRPHVVEVANQTGWRLPLHSSASFPLDACGWSFRLIKAGR